jgi:uncharacterized protein YggL (DUF469 family)
MDARHVRDERQSGFEQMGFPLRFVFTRGTSPATLGAVLDAFQFEALDPVSLVCAGAVHAETFQGFVTRWKGSATEEDRRSLSAWLASRPEVAEHEVGRLMGAWYGVDRAARYVGPASRFPTTEAG